MLIHQWDHIVKTLWGNHHYDACALKVSSGTDIERGQIKTVEPILLSQEWTFSMLFLQPSWRWQESTNASKLRAKSQNGACNVDGSARAKVTEITETIFRVWVQVWSEDRGKPFS